MKLRLVVLGMAIQSFIVAFLTAVGLITPTPGQQAVAGILFLIFIGIISLVPRLRKKEVSKPQI